MHEKIKIRPLADESFGVRSMCTYIETKDTKILLDAGAALASIRLGYPPHPREYQALAESRKRINKAAEKADIITISHYHFDHYTPSYTDWLTNWCSAETAKQIYMNKIVLAKSHRSKVNANQRRRGWIFKKTAGKYAKRLESADGRTFEFGETKLRFSEPVFHGLENSELGWIVMLSIDFAGERVVFASDVQGPMYTPTLDKILVENPQVLLISGPPTYLVGLRVKDKEIKTGIQSLKTIVESVPKTILQHHILRDENWKSLFQPVLKAAMNAGHKTLTAAEYLGKENNFLEFQRRQLFETEPPDSDFKTWMKLPLQKRKLTKPPI